MLIYDHNKEFTGIDQETLKLLGYERFDDLIHEHRDVAELFVKKPGYIHNFTNFPWIDFVLHAESDDAKVIIAGKSKAFSATIDIATLYLNKAPNEEAYLIRLKNIQNYQLDAADRPEPTPAPFEPTVEDFDISAEPAKPAARPEPTPAAIPEPEPEPIEEPAALTFDDDIFIQEEETPAAASFEAPSAVPASDDHEEELDIFFHDEEESIEEEPARYEPLPEPEVPVEKQSVLDNLKEEKSTPMLGAYLSETDKAYLADLKYSDDYVYDPNIAADELGLPVDLIEEFIGDFIKQAHEFKDQLFRAVKDSDFDTIKVLSHKLKGVAANLRIEDSFEVLRNVNETADIKECEANLKKFYITIGKLEGKDLEEIKQELEQPTEEELYDLTPKFTPVAEEEEEPLLPLDLPELDEAESSAEPVLLEKEYDDLKKPSAAKEESHDIYDFGLITEEGSEPMMVLDDEEEIMSDIKAFESVKEEKPAASEAPAAEEEEEVPSGTVLTYDVNTAAAEIGLSPDLVTALIEDYIVEANEMKSKLEDVVATSDAVRWKGYATQLKGVSDNLRIKEISDVLQQLITSTQEKQAKAAIQEFYGLINQL